MMSGCTYGVLARAALHRRGRDRASKRPVAHDQPDREALSPNESPQDGAPTRQPEELRRKIVHRELWMTA